VSWKPLVKSKPRAVMTTSVISRSLLTPRKYALDF
jgi:hypothetical protein